MLLVFIQYILTLVKKYSDLFVFNHTTHYRIVVIKTVLVLVMFLFLVEVFIAVITVMNFYFKLKKKKVFVLSV